VALETTADAECRGRGTFQKGRRWFGVRIVAGRGRHSARIMMLKIGGGFGWLCWSQSRVDIFTRLSTATSKSLIKFTSFQLLLISRSSDIQNERFQHESGAQHAVVGMPSLRPLHETSVRNHTLVVCMPALFHCQV